MSGMSKCPEQFRGDTVGLARSSDRPWRRIARELGVNRETLRSWVRTAGNAQVGGVSADERQELRELFAGRECVVGSCGAQVLLQEGFPAGGDGGADAPDHLREQGVAEVGVDLPNAVLDGCV